VSAATFRGAPRLRAGASSDRRPVSDSSPIDVYVRACLSADLIARHRFDARLAWRLRMPDGRCDAGRHQPNRQVRGSEGVGSGTDWRAFGRFKPALWKIRVSARDGMIPTAGLAVFTTAATVLYIGLAVISGGGFTIFFDHPARVALVLILLALGGASAFTRGNMSPGEREDRGNRWVISVLGLLGLLIAILPPYTDRVGFWTFGGDTVRWLGVVIFAAGGALRLWPVFVLGPHGSVDWSRSNPDIRSSRVACTASSGTPAILACW
jgi:hypothetical protein